MSSDPTRWTEDDGTPAAIRELLEVGRGERAPELDEDTRDAAATFAAKLAAGGVGLGAGAGSGAGITALFTGKLGAKMAIGLLAVAAVAGAGTVYLDDGASETDAKSPAAVEPREEAPDEAVLHAPAARAPTGEAEAAPDEVEDEAERAEPPPPAADPATPSRRDRRSHAREAPPAEALGAPGPTATQDDAAGLAEEAALLERARRVMESEPSRTLALVDDHRRHHPAGQLAAERELIAVQALLRLGREADARRRAETWIAAHPDGLYARRLRRLIGDADVESSP